MLRKVEWAVKWTPVYPSPTLSNYWHPVFLLNFPLVLFPNECFGQQDITLLTTSTWNHVRQRHFLPNNNVLHLIQLALIQNHEATCKISSVVAKISVLAWFNSTEDLVKFNELKLVMSFSSVKALEFPAVLYIWLFEESSQAFLLAEQTMLCFNKYVYDLT